VTPTHFQWTRFWAPEGITTHDHGFLPDPESMFGDQRLVTFDQIVDIPCLILLGNPGIGKSRSIQQIAQHISAVGALCVLKDFREFDNFGNFLEDIAAEPDFQMWESDQNKNYLHLFLDSLDEGRLEMKRLHYDLQRFVSQLPIDRLYLRVSCRSAELPVNFVDLMKDIWQGDDQRKQVQVYTLAQLRQRDAYQAAIQHPNIDADAFIDTIKQFGIEAFAAYPVTLVDMLFRIFEARPNDLPTSRGEIYRQGCRELASEISTSRRDDRHIGQFTTETRLEAARQIAALSLVGNRPRISKRFMPDDTALLLQDCFLREANIWSEPEHLLDETLDTALFAASGNYRIWSHRSYGEYLAAEYIDQAHMPLQQVQNLFINPVDPDKRISPKLYEVAAWLATMSDDIFDWIFHAEPWILIKSDSIQLTIEQKTLLIDQFIQRYNTDGIIEVRLDWNDLHRLDYPGLGNQLQPHLANENLSSQARELCMDFVITCDVTSIDATLIAMALDADESPQLRSGALRTLESPKRQDESIKALRPLIFQASEHKANATLVARAIDILWPQHLSATELFKRLRLQNMNEVVIGSPYDELFRSDLVEQLSDSNLLIALDWVRHQATEREHTVSLSGREFVMSIMRRAWDRLDVPIIREAFALAAWSRLTHFNPVIEEVEHYWRKDQASRKYADELYYDEEKRRLLLQSMLSVLKRESLDKDRTIGFLLPWGSRTIPFVTNEDIPWLLEQTRHSESADRHWAYAYLIRRLVGLIDTDLLAEIYEEYETGQNLAIRAHFWELFDAVALDSERAQAGRAELVQEREYKQQELERESKKLPVEKLVREWLLKCESDSANWWLLNLSLLMNEYGSYNNGTWDLRKGNGWQTIQDDTYAYSKVIAAAIRFIKEQNPYIGNAEPHVPIRNRHPALAGYRAFFLIVALGFDVQLTVDDWRRWADAIVFNDFDKGTEGAEIHDLLLRRAFEYASDHLLSQLEKIIDSEQDDYQVETLLRRFSTAPTESLDQLLLACLERSKSEQELFVILLAHLLRSGRQPASQAQALGIRRLYEHPASEQEFDINKRIISTFASYSQDVAWWAVSWKLLTSDKAFAETVFDAIAERHHSPYLQRLAEYELYNLYLLAAELFVYSDDIDFRGGTVPPRHTQQQWRDGILKELAGRGTLKSVSVLTELFIQKPDLPGIGYLVQQAKSNFRTESWTAPQPITILKLATDQHKRLVRNADQLLDLVLEGLQEIQRKYRGSAAMKTSVWNRQPDGSYRPYEEETFSTAIAEWLRDYSSQVTINREPWVTQKPQSKERTDIQVECISDTGQPLMVIIEVKGCWYDDIIERMQTQLVDQYIANHNRCRHGIYLVGYFASDSWDKRDSRRKSTCSGRSENTLIQNLQARALTLMARKPITVKPFVFDASL